MKSEKTAKELELAIKEEFGASLAYQVADRIVEILIRELGVELAPEKPELPGWTEHPVGKGLFNRDSAMSLKDGTILVTPKHPVQAGALVALVEIHRRWLAAKRELERWSDGPVYPHSSDLAPHLLRILRGEGE